MKTFCVSLNQTELAKSMRQTDKSLTLKRLVQFIWWSVFIFCLFLSSLLSCPSGGLTFSERPLSSPEWCVSVWVSVCVVRCSYCSKTDGPYSLYSSNTHTHGHAHTVTCTSETKCSPTLWVAGRHVVSVSVCVCVYVCVRERETDWQFCSEQFTFSSAVLNSRVDVQGLE